MRPAAMKGMEVDSMVIFLPILSRAVPPVSPPTRAARGISDPTQEASVSEIGMELPSAWREAIAGEDHADVNPTTRDPRETAIAALIWEQVK